MYTISPELRQAIEQAGDEPVRLEDPERQTAYILVREDVFRRMQTLMVSDDGELTIEEQKILLFELGKSVGWDDPAMDVYNDPGPRP
jgi:hypothetical protein